MRKNLKVREPVGGKLQFAAPPIILAGTMPLKAF
jgi:hypothetical protein